MTTRIATGLAALLLLSACARGEDAQPVDNMSARVDPQAALEEEPVANGADNATDAGLPTDAWIGKWIGVEGLVLDIQSGDGAGRYLLSVTLLDGTKSYEGTAEGELIRFTRDGRPESVRKATGDETGLKWLAGKTNCLMIQQGEGFCRDDKAKPSPSAPAPAPAPAA